MNRDVIRLTAPHLPRPTRLDRVLAEAFPAWPRREIQTLVNAKRVRVNGRVVWLCSWLVSTGDKIEIAGRPKREKPAALAFDRSWVIREEADLIAVAKPEGLLSHATRAERERNLLTMMIAAYGHLSLFHRLDRDTSGVVLFTRSIDTNRYLDTAFKEGTVEKDYLAAVAAPHELASEGVIRAPIGVDPRRRERMRVDAHAGKQALTRYAVLGEAEGMALVRLRPETGRTHQLRVHLAHFGAPILGDVLYGPTPPAAPRLLLHAWRIGLPALDGFPERRYAAPPPESFLSLLPKALRALLR
ncbi:MAG: RluA family pseudouridine synthase [Myxococcales bacterium]|nr:MAG: RluA family pseudouridine synthase [Myxococcales bacterium]